MRPMFFGILGKLSREAEVYIRIQTFTSLDCHLLDLLLNGSILRKSVFRELALVKVIVLVASMCTNTRSLHR